MWCIIAITFKILNNIKKNLTEPSLWSCLWTQFILYNIGLYGRYSRVEDISIPILYRAPVKNAKYIFLHSNRIIQNKYKMELICIVNIVVYFIYQSHGDLNQWVSLWTDIWLVFYFYSERHDRPCIHIIFGKPNHIVRIWVEKSIKLFDF